MTPTSEVVKAITEADLDVTDELLQERYGKSTHAKEFLIELEKQYKQWLRQQNKLSEPKISRESVREMLIGDLQFVTNMSTEEYTLYRKWLEIHENETISEWKALMESADFEAILAGEKSLRDSIALKSYQKIEEAKNLQWRPSVWDKSIISGQYSDESVPAICPEVVPCRGNAELTEYWNIARTLSHTMINNTNIGRNLRFIVRDANSQKSLGLFCLSSDFLDVSVRDEYLGWSREARTQGRMINHLAIASTVLPLQPFGYNYCGGKLIALMAMSDKAENAWNEAYGEKRESKLVGVTTTSLYSSFSQYNSLTYWKPLGQTKGLVKREPRRETFERAKQYLKQEYPREYWQWFIATEPGGMPLKRDNKQRALTFILSKLNIDRKLFDSPGDERGVYFCNLFENSREYLRNEVGEDDLVRRPGFDNSVEALTNLWKEKYAMKRIEKLSSEGRVSHEELFYSELAMLSWDETKARYLHEVGR